MSQEQLTSVLMTIGEFFANDFADPVGVAREYHLRIGHLPVHQQVRTLAHVLQQPGRAAVGREVLSDDPRLRFPTPEPATPRLIGRSRSFAPR